MVNSSFQLLPSADVMFGGDRQFWNFYKRNVKSGTWDAFQGERWTTSSLAAREHPGINLVRPKSGEGVSNTHIFTGGNSGYQAVGLARLFGARRIVLLGYDMQRTGGKHHWHADYPKEMGNGVMHNKWQERFDRLVPQLAALGVDVVNATRTTALRAPRRMSLEDALCV